MVGVASAASGGALLPERDPGRRACPARTRLPPAVAGHLAPPDADPGVVLGSVAACARRHRMVALTPRSRALRQESRPASAGNRQGARRHGADTALATGAKLGPAEPGPAHPHPAHPTGAAYGHAVCGARGTGRAGFRDLMPARQWLDTRP